MNPIRSLMLLGLLLPFCAFSQFSKGTWAPGLTIGGVFFDAGTTEYAAAPPTIGYTSSTNSLGFNLNPSLAFFVSDRTMLGARITAGFQYDKYIDAVNNITFRKKEDRISQWGLGVFGRSYFRPGGKYLPFVQAGLDAGIGGSRTEGFNYTSSYRESYVGKSNGNFFTSAGLQLGLTRMLSGNVGLDISAGYLFTHQRKKTRTETLRDIDTDGQPDEQLISEITVKSNNHGFSLNVGMVVFLQCRGK